MHCLPAVSALLRFLSPMFSRTLSPSFTLHPPTMRDGSFADHHQRQCNFANDSGSILGIASASTLVSHRLRSLACRSLPSRISLLAAYSLSLSLTCLGPHSSRRPLSRHPLCPNVWGCITVQLRSGVAFTQSYVSEGEYSTECITGMSESLRTAQCGVGMCPSISHVETRQGASASLHKGGGAPTDRRVSKFLQSHCTAYRPRGALSSLCVLCAVCAVRAAHRSHRSRCAPCIPSSPRASSFCAPFAPRGSHVVLVARPSPAASVNLADDGDSANAAEGRHFVKPQARVPFAPGKYQGKRGCR